MLQQDFAWAQGLNDDNRQPNLPRIFNERKYGSPNTCLGSNEVEGRASTIDTTLIVGGRQWQTLVSWCELHCRRFRYPPSRDRITGHYEWSTKRTDPGPAFPWADLIQDVTAAVAEPWVRENGKPGRDRPYTRDTRRVALPPRPRKPVAVPKTGAPAPAPSVRPVAQAGGLTAKQREHVRAIQRHAESLQKS